MIIISVVDETHCTVRQSCLITMLEIFLSTPFHFIHTHTHSHPSTTTHTNLPLKHPYLPFIPFQLLFLKQSAGMIHRFCPHPSLQQTHYNDPLWNQEKPLTSGFQRTYSNANRAASVLSNYAKPTECEHMLRLRDTKPNFIHCSNFLVQTLKLKYFLRLSSDESKLRWCIYEHNITKL